MLLAGEGYRLTDLPVHLKASSWYTAEKGYWKHDEVRVWRLMVMTLLNSELQRWK